jgi:hypothetical protein
VRLLVFGFLEKSNASLTYLATVCQDLAIQISPQGLDERFNPQSVAFLQAVFARSIQVFQNQVPLLLPLLQQFSAILIVDSSVQALPEAMQTIYPGCGGGGSKASLKIQLVFDFLYGNLCQIALTRGRANDQSYRDYLAVVLPGSLTIVDLGYFCLDAFRAIMDKQAYFLSRYLYPTALLTLQGERIDLLAWLRAEIRASLDQAVLLGVRQSHRLPCRLIAVRVPLAVAEERRRKAIEKARQHGKTLTQDYLFLLSWSLFLTNVPTQRLSLEQVVLLYRVRWQIELIFKLWKSDCGLNDLGLWRKDRLLTELYAKMIASVLCQFLVAPLRLPGPDGENREISTVQARRILAHFAASLNQSLTHQVAFSTILQGLLVQFVRLAAKQKRVKRPNVCQRLATALA